MCIIIKRAQEMKNKDKGKTHTFMLVSLKTMAELASDIDSTRNRTHSQSTEEKKGRTKRMVEEKSEGMDAPKHYTGWRAVENTHKFVCLWLTHELIQLPSI